MPGGPGYDRFGRLERFVSLYAPKRGPEFADRLKADIEAKAERVKDACALRTVVRAIVEGQEAKEELAMLKAGDMANTVIKTFQDAMQRAMTDANTQIGGATDEMVQTIRTGAANVKRAIQAETMKVQEAFGTVVGNATDAAEEAVADAKKLAEGGQ